MSPSTPVETAGALRAGALSIVVVVCLAAPAPAGAELKITGDTDAWKAQPGPWNVTYYWITCDQPTHDCRNSYTVQLKAWPVYSESHSQAHEGFVDYFLIQMTANLNVGGCWDVYRGNQEDRISAYWLRRFEVSADVIPPEGMKQWSHNDLQLDSSQYNPRNANPSATVNQGITWSLGGKGTVGAKGLGVEFSAGMSFTNSNTTSYDALKIIADVQPAGRPLYVGWGYDSWDFVHSTFQPSNQTCVGGGGLRPLPPILTSTATTVQTWLYQASPAVREAFGDKGLPIRFDLGVQLGYAFYANLTGNCPVGSGGRTRTPIGTFPLNQNRNLYTVGDLDHPETQGLAFDVSCGPRTQYGTIPLGPPLSARPGTSDDFDPNWGPGNPGDLLRPAEPWIVYIPFADKDASETEQASGEEEVAR